MNRDKDILPSNYYGSPEHPIVLPEVLVTAKRPSIVKRWTDPENGRTVFDWVSNHNWPMESPSGRWLSNKNGNWMWTDLLKVPVTLFHKKGGKLNEKD